jgi:glycosyltransferase involved in cell wall biosynthesis
MSFLPAPNIYCILGKLLSLRTVTVLVGERSSGRGRQGRTAAFVTRLLYGMARYLVANSVSQTNHLYSYPWLRDKVRCIYNGYSPIPVSPAVFAPNPILRLLVVGRISPAKNGLKLVQALSLFAQRHGFSPSVSWVGRQEMDTKSLALRADMDRLLAENPMVQRNWRWLGELDHVYDLLIEHDGLVLASLFEGLPNVVCEAFIAGRPAIISAVCDHPLLVGDDERGFLFDPASSESLCAAIERFVSLSPEQRHAMGLRARRYAEEYLTVDRMVDEYLSLVRREA